MQQQEDTLLNTEFLRIYWASSEQILFVSFIHSFIHSSMFLQPFVGPWHLLYFRNFIYTDRRTPWTSDQPVARPLPTHSTTQTQKKHTHRHPCLEWFSNSWSKLSSERGSSCLRPRGHHIRPIFLLFAYFRQSATFIKEVLSETHTEFYIDTHWN
jgi:hypothetical protein